MLHTERRRFPRYNVNFFLKTIDILSQKELEARTRDLCAGGLGLNTNHGLQPGTNLDICLFMPDNGEQIFTCGTVIWLKQEAVDKYTVGIKLSAAELKPIPLVLRTLRLKNKHYSC